MIIGRYVPTTLGLHLKFYENIIISGEIPNKGCLAPIVDLINYDFKPLTGKIFKP